MFFLGIVQQMAKSASSKVVFVPMQLQSDLGGAAASGSGLNAMVQNESSHDILGPAGRAAVLNSASEL